MGIAEGAPHSILPNKMGRAAYSGPSSLLASQLMNSGEISLLKLHQCYPVWAPSIIALSLGTIALRSECLCYRSPLRPYYPCSVANGGQVVCDRTLASRALGSSELLNGANRSGPSHQPSKVWRPLSSDRHRETSPPLATFHESKSEDPDAETDIGPEKAAAGSELPASFITRREDQSGSHSQDTISKTLSFSPSVQDGSSPRQPLPTSFAPSPSEANAAQPPLAIECKETNKGLFPGIAEPSGVVDLSLDGASTHTYGKALIQLELSADTAIGTIGQQEGTARVTSQEGTIRVTSQEGTMQVTSQEKTVRVASQEGTMRATSQEGTVRVTSQEGTMQVTLQPLGTYRLVKRKIACLCCLHYQK